MSKMDGRFKSMVSRKNMLRKEIIDSIDEALETADNRGCLDYFEIKIVNHNGKLQVEKIIKERKNIY